MDSNETPPFDLKDEIDKAAGHLLKTITDEGTKTGLRERVDAFNAIVKWHELSAKAGPEPKEIKRNVAPIDRIKRKFDGGGSKRGAGNGAATAQ